MKRLGFALASWPFAIVLRFWSALVLLTSRVVLEGAEPEGPAVYVNWHRHLPFVVAHHGRRRRWMMVSGAAYMAPIARYCRLMGLRLIRGASGEGGRKALAELERILAAGGSVVLAVDGPAGPAFVTRPGCVELAARTGAPLIPLAVGSTRAVELVRRWDRMRIPLPFGRIVVRIGAPVEVRGDPASACLAVTAALQTLERDGPQRLIGRQAADLNP